MAFYIVLYKITVLKILLYKSLKKNVKNTKKKKKVYN